MPGDQLSDDPWLVNTYVADPDAIDFSELMVITNVLSGCKDVTALFWENKLGVDVDVRVHCISVRLSLMPSIIG